MKFLDLICWEIEKQDIYYRAKTVKYYEKDKIHGEITLFDKSTEYEYQREFRIVLYTDEIKPITLKIGNLSEIAELFEINAIDDMKWTCFNDGLATSENVVSKANLTIYPNPVKNGELNISGKDLTNIKTAHIFDYSGKIVQSISQPFKNSNKIILKNLPKGVYILRADHQSAKFIIQ